MFTYTFVVLLNFYTNCSLLASFACKNALGKMPSEIY